MSFKIGISPRRKSYIRLHAQIMHELNKSLAEECDKNGKNKAKISSILGKDKSVITKLFSGKQNMTLETLSDLSYALNRRIELNLVANIQPETNNGSNSAAAVRTSTFAVGK